MLGFGEHARVTGPPQLVADARERLDRIVELHRGDPTVAVSDGVPPVAVEPEDTDPEPRARGGADAAIRPERFARLVTLASVLIEAGRAGKNLEIAGVRERLQISEQELREDISVLNVVNFGGGTYVLYAEIHPDGTIEVDTEPYSDTFDRPARLLPIEAKALIAAIDLIGSHLPAGALDSARDKIVHALGEDPVSEGLQVTTGGDDSHSARIVADAIEGRRLLALEYIDGQGKASTRTIEPYALINGREGWYVSAYDPAKEEDPDGGTRHFRLDRIKRAEKLEQAFEPRADLDPLADIEGWPRTGEVENSGVAHVWISPEQARWAREKRTVLAELPDGAIVVEWTYKGEAFLVKEVLKEAGDAAVLEPAHIREAVLAAAESRLAGAR